MSGTFNIRNLINVYHANILELCSKIPGNKVLMLHDDVSKIINKLSGTDLLDKAKVIKIITLVNYSINPTYDKIVCLLPSDYDSVKMIISFIKSDKEKNITRKMVLGFVPFLSESCKYLLTKEDLPLENIGIFDLKLGWIPLDDDLLTLNSSYLYSSSFLHRNSSWCYFFGEMLADVLIIGLDRPTYLCQIYSLGETSNWCFRGLSDACNKSSSNFKQSDSKTGSTNVFIFSRDLDYITPFCLPITFEGMMHEVMSIDLGQVTFTKEITGETEKKEAMNNSNSVFKEIRALPLMSVMPKLVSLKRNFDDTKSNLDVMKSPDQLMTFVSEKMPQALQEGKQLNQCFSAYDHIIKETTYKDRVDDLMTAQATLLMATDDCEFPKYLITEFLTSRYETKQFDALRLLCLWTATHDGLPNNVYDEMYRLICHSFGYPIIYLLQNLRNLRLFAPRQDFIERSRPVVGSNLLNVASLTGSSSSSNLATVKQMVIQYKSHYFYLKSYLKLSSEKQMSNTQDTLNYSFIFGGHHSPVCSSIIDEVCKKTTESIKDENRSSSNIDSSSLKPKKIIFPIDEAMRHLNISQEAAANYGKVPLGSGTSLRSSSVQGNIETIIACFVGGCCYAEIAALRHMSKIHNWNLIILTSNILKTKDLIFQVSTAD